MIAASLIFKDGADQVRAMVEDLLDSDFAPLSAAKVAVDNGSEDGTIAEWLEGRGWIVIRNPANIGIPAARNQTYWRIAGQFPETEHVLELHADMRFPGIWCQALMAEMQDPDVWMSCASIVRGLRAPYIPVTLAVQDPAKVPRDVIEAFCTVGRYGGIQLDPFAAKLAHPCLFRLEPFKARGFYDDRYLWQEMEDTDVYYDYVFNHKKKVVISPRSWVVHYTGFQRIQFWKQEHYIHNQAMFRQKWNLPADMTGDQLNELLFGFNPKSGL